MAIRDGRCRARSSNESGGVAGGGGSAETTKEPVIPTRPLPPETQFDTADPYARRDFNRDSQPSQALAQEPSPSKQEQEPVYVFRHNGGVPSGLQGRHLFISAFSDRISPN